MDRELLCRKLSRKLLRRRRGARRQAAAVPVLGSACWLCCAPWQPYLCASDLPLPGDVSPTSSSKAHGVISGNMTRTVELECLCNVHCDALHHHAARASVGKGPVTVCASTQRGPARATICDDMMIGSSAQCSTGTSVVENCMHTASIAIPVFGALAAFCWLEYCCNLCHSHGVHPIPTAHATCSADRTGVVVIRSFDGLNQHDCWRPASWTPCTS